MSETLNYIEAYFENSLSTAEKQVFEQRCVTDTAFAGEVAFYVAAREGMRQELLEQKRKLWLAAEAENGATTQPAMAPVRTLNFRKWLPYAAAASLLAAILIIFLYVSDSPEQLADAYIENNLMQLGQKMSGETDSLEMGINAYNRKEYDSALRLFDAVSRANAGNGLAKKYSGLSHLMKQEYGLALLRFNELAVMKIYSNPGVFLKAVTLLKRDGNGDKELARKLLEQVRQDGLEGNKEAAGWLEKW